MFNQPSLADLDINTSALVVDLPQDVKPAATDASGNPAEVTLLTSKTRRARMNFLILTEGTCDKPRT